MDWVPLTDVNVGTVSSLTNQLHRPFKNISFFVRKPCSLRRIHVTDVKIFHFELVRPVVCNSKLVGEHRYTLNVSELIASLSNSFEFDPCPRGQLSGLRLSVGTLSPSRKILECYRILKTGHDRLKPDPS
jgi:hypothetical protein